MQQNLTLFQSSGDSESEKWNETDRFALERRQFVWERYSIGKLSSQRVTVSLRNATRRNAFPLISQQLVWENRWSRTFSVGVKEPCLNKQITRIRSLQLFKWLKRELINRYKSKFNWKPQATTKKWRETNFNLDSSKFQMRNFPVEEKTLMKQDLASTSYYLNNFLDQYGKAKKIKVLQATNPQKSYRIPFSKDNLFCQHLDEIKD